MRIVLDMDPVDVWRIQAEADERHIGPGDVVREVFAKRPTYLAYRNEVRKLVRQGLCDAEIAERLGRAPGSIAGTRRRIGLPANPRYPKKSAAAAERNTR